MGVSGLSSGRGFLARQLRLKLRRPASFARADEATGKKDTGAAQAVGWSTSSSTKPAAQKLKLAKKAKPNQKTTAVVEKDTWICPMCRIKADKPGKCPECGMDMVKLPKESKKK